MKTEMTMFLCAFLAWTVFAQAAEKAAKEGLEWDVGADLRVRHELHDNVPQYNAAGAVSGNQSYLRVRPRVWGAIENEDFKIYTRLADEFREYFQPSESRNSQFPDEILVDNLYLDLYGLFGDWLDLRIGRQDFIGPQGPEYGAGRVLMDGTSGDGSRTCFFDAIKATVKFAEKNTLDLLAIYNKAENELSWGHPKGADGSSPKERQMTYNVPGATDMDEYGGGLYFKSREWQEFPFDIYYLFKRETKARLGGATLPGRDTHTIGARVMPQLTETLSAELEGAGQAGERDGGKAVRGYMGYAGLTYKPAVERCKPFVTLACYYLSGDRNHGTGDNDTAWNPLWARWPQYSEMYPYHDRGVCYWSNLIYPSLTVGSRFANGHKVSANVGPMYAAEEDGLGGGSGDLYGWFGMCRYDFPLLKNIFGKRGDLTGHLTAEVLDPGDYYVSDTVAYFLRWEVTYAF